MYPNVPNILRTCRFRPSTIVRDNSRTPRRCTIAGRVLAVMDFRRYDDNDDNGDGPPVVDVDVVVVRAELDSVVMTTPSRQAWMCESTIGRSTVALYVLGCWWRSCKTALGNRPSDVSKMRPVVSLSNRPTGKIRL